VVFAFFILISYVLYRLGGYLAAPGEAHRQKHLPYTGGEDLPPPPSRLTYHAFFRLALMFGILHVAALVVSTVPASRVSHRVALVYLIGIGISVMVLARDGRRNP
jgi:hypothetical protein